MSAYTVRLAEQVRAWMGQQGKKHRGQSAPRNNRHRTRPQGRGATPSTIPAAGVDPTAGGSEQELVGVP